MNSYCIAKSEEKETNKSKMAKSEEKETNKILMTISSFIIKVCVLRVIMWICVMELSE